MWSFEGSQWHPVGSPGGNYAIARVWRFSGYWFGNKIYRLHSNYNRVNAGSYPQQVAFAPSPLEVPQTIPFVTDPLSRPINVPVPVPLPLPFKVIPYVRPNPDRAPGEQDERGPTPRRTRPPFFDPYSEPDLLPFAVPGRRPVQAVRPDQLPPAGPTLTIDASSGGGIGRDYTPHDLRPPRRGTKEHKFIALDPRITPILSPITEAIDAIVAIHDALPKDCKNSHRTVQSMLVDLWHCWERLDAGKAVLNLIAEGREDRALGKVGEELAKASREFGKPTGFQFFFNNVGRFL